MALVINDRVKETTATTGTGTVTLAGAVAGFDTFLAGIGNSNTTYYCIQLNAEFEVGLGTLAGDSSTLARTTVISSSNSDNAVNFSAGSKFVFCTMPASKATVLDASGNLTLPGDISITDDAKLISDAAVLSFGANSEVTLTHVHNDGLLLNTDMQLQFRDSAINIRSDADGDLDINADDEIELNSTLIDINGNVEISGTTAQVGVLTTTATQVATGGITSGSNIVSDTDSTDDLGTTSVRWANLFVDGITATDQITATGFTGTLDGILGSGTPAAATVSSLTSGGNVVSDTDSTDDLGTTSVRWANLFVDGITATDQITATGFTGTLDGILGSGTAAAATTTDLASTTITASGIVKTDDTTNATSTTDGSLQTDGGLSVALDAVFGDDVKLLTDSAVLSFGAGSDATLTHTNDVGLTLNSTNKLMFNDATQFIQGASGTVLNIAATDEVDITSTLIDINGNVEISGTTAQVGVATFTARDIHSGGITVADAGNIGSASDLDAIAIGADGDITLTQDLELQHDGAILSFGANDEIALTHVHDTGLLLTDSGGTPTLQLHDANESISSDGSKVIITSGGVAFSMPTADGSAGQFIKTNGSAVLSFDTVSSAADDITIGDSAVLITTSSGNITLDAAAGDSDIIFKGTDGSADTTFLTIDGSDAGKLLPNNGMDLNGKELILDADADTSITADTDDKIDFRIGGADTMQMNATAFSGGAIYENADDIAADYSITAGKNAFSVGPITIASGVTVTVPSGQRWVIL